MAGKTSNLIEYQDEGATFYPVARATTGLVFQGLESGLGSPENPLAFPVIPKSAKVVINSYRQPDSWELVFDARDLPFDPQKIRMGTVEIAMFLTNGIEDEKRLLDRQFSESEDAGIMKARGYVEVQRARKEIADMDASDRKERATDARRTYFEENEPLITGLFDEAGINCSSSGRWVTLSGQDYTAMLIGRQWHPLAGGRARRVPTGQRADDFAEALLREVDPNGVLTVKVMGMRDAELPKIYKDKDIGLKGRGVPIEKETSYWDVIYKTLTRHGLLCYFRNNDLIITRPRSVEQLKQDVRYLDWGVNLETIDLDRHFGRAQVPIIILQCMDEHGEPMKNPIVEPPEHQKHAELIMKGKPAGKTSFVEKSKSVLSPTAKKAKKPKAPLIKETDQYEIETVHGVHDEKILREYARLLRYLRGRGERTITFSTHHLMDLMGRPLLGLDTGDPIMVGWRDFDHAELAKQTPARRYEDLVERGYQPDVAQAIADSFDELIGTQRPLRVSEITYAWDCDNGIEITGKALDFITGGEDGKASPNLAASIGKGAP